MNEQNDTSRQTNPEGGKRNLAESLFFAAMGTLGDVVFLSVLWLIFSLPLVTVGASTTAAFAVAGKIAARQDYFVRRDFMAAFKRDWRIATRVWAVLAVVLIFLVADYQIGLANPGSWGGVLIAVAAAMGLCWLCVLGGGFALLGRFGYTRVRDVLKDGALLCVANPTAVLVWLIVLLFMPLLHKVVPALYDYLYLPWLFLGGGTAITLFSFALRPAFTRLEKKK